MAKARRNDTARLAGFARRPRQALLVSTALQATAMLVLSLPAGAQPAVNAQPNGGTVVAGTAAISQSATNTRIDQSTQRAAIDWRSFNVGAQQSVTFNQPSASAVTLNRVTGSDPSHIAGRITANGQLILVNQSGVNFYKGAQVNAAGVMVSTASITKENFMNGVMKFDIPGKPNARIDNQGSITVKDAGLAALVAPQVSNSGTISARLGRVVLAGSPTATLDLYGDGLLSLNVTGQVTEAPVGSDGKTATALVTNTGVLIADGGTVQLTARAADGILQNLIQAGGTISAATVHGRTGTVALNGIGGSIVVEGQLAAQGISPGSKGGAIEVVSKANVIVAAGATINASGKAGGGTVAIGTTLQRAKVGPTATTATVATNTVIHKGAKVSASATGQGDGGNVTVLSRNLTAISGDIEAKGGPQGGNGGFVELSGYAGFVASGQVDTSAPQGRQGTILLDPENLRVIAGNGTEDGDFITNLGNVLAGDGKTGTPDTIDNTVINGFAGNVELQAIDTLQVSAPIALTKAGASLTLRAGNDLVIDEGIAISTNGGAATLRAADSSITGFNPNGGLTFAGSLSGITTLTMSAGTGGIALNGNITANVVDLSTTGVINQSGGLITATVLQSSGNVSGTVVLTKGNAIASLGNFTVLGGNQFVLGGSVALAVNGALTATGGTVQLQTSDAVTGITIAAGGSVNVGNGPTGGTAAFFANAFSVAGGGSVTARLFELTPNVASVMTVGTGGLLTSLAGISADRVSLGRVSGVTTADSITFSSTVNFGGAAVALASNGGITATAGALQNVGELSIQATGAVELTNAANSIGVLGQVNVTGAGNSLKLLDSVDLAVNGPVAAAQDISLTTTGATKIAVGGDLAANGTLTLAAGTSGIALIAGSALSGATVDISTSGGGVTQAAGGSLTSGTLRSTSGVTGSAGLAGTANAVTSLGVFTVTGGDFLLSSTGAVALNGPLSAASVTVQTTGGASAISVAGKVTGTIGVTLDSGLVTLGAGADVRGPFITLSGDNGIALTGNALLGMVGAVLDLTSSAGGVTEAATASVTAATLVSSGGVDGTVALVGTNAINTLGQFNAAGQSFTLLDAGAVSLQVSGLTADVVDLTAPAIAIAGAVTGTTSVNLVATAGGISETGSITTVLLTGSANAAVGLTGSNAISALGPFSAVGQNFKLLDANAASLAVNGLSAALVDINAPSIAIPGALTGTTSVSLVATTGGISETGSITTPLLTGSTATNANFAGATPAANLIGKLGPFATKTGFLLNDGASLAVVGAVATGVGQTIALRTDNLSIGAAVTAPGGTVAIAPVTPGRGISLDAVANAGALSLRQSDLANISTATLALGSVDGGTTLLASALAVNTPINLTTIAGTLGLYSAGPISGTGGLSVATLTGRSTGPVGLTGANAIAALGPFDAVGQSFTLNDPGAASLAVNGLTADAISLTAPVITIPGTLTATTSVNLAATAGGISETGSITTPLLTGSAAGPVDLTGTNAIATVGLFSAAGQGFKLLDGNVATLTVSGLSGGVVNLTAPAISISGALSGSTSVNLVATGGGISETGSITTALLTGSATGTVDLTGSNAIAALGPFDATGQSFTLLDAGAASLAVGGLSSTTISLTAPAITIPGSIAGTTSVHLVATGGGISESGSITSPLLTGAAAGAVGLTGANTIAALGPFDAPGQVFTLLDAGAPSLIVNAVSAAAISLTAQMITIPGTIVGTSSVNLAATGGGISEAGGIVTAQLTGSATGEVDLTGSNTIAALGPFDATGQTFTLLDAGAASLAVNGLNATIIDLTAPAITIPGVIAGTTSVNLTATGGGIGGTGSLTSPLLTGSATGPVALTGTNAITALGLFDAAGQSFALLDSGVASLAVSGLSAAAISLTGPAITVPGTIVGTTSVNLAATAGGIVETGSIASPLLTGSATGAVDLTGSNTIASLGPFNAAGQSFTLLDAGVSSLAVNGLDAATIVLTAPVITIPGSIAGASSVNLVATAGGISETGSIASPLLTGSATGTVDLTGSNAIAALGPFSATGQSFSLSDAGAASLTVNGLDAATIALTAPVITVPGSIAGTTSVNLVATAGGISETGSVASPLLTGSAAGTVDLTGSNTIAALGPFDATGQIFTLLDANAASLLANGVTAAAISLTAPIITIPGSISASGSVNLVATGGGISEAGSIASPLLTGSATGAVDLTGSNAIDTLGPFDATRQSFALLDANAASLAVNGLTAATVSLTAPIITIPGAIAGTTSVNLAATGGGISETGSVTTALLTGSATGTVDLVGSNAIAALGPFNAAGQSFTLLDAGAASLVVNGLNAAAISLTAPIITIPGAIAATTSVNLMATGGGISETGSIGSPLLTGSATGTVGLAGSNAIAALGPFDAVGQSFSLLDAGAASLAVNGLNAAAINLMAPVITIPGSIAGTTSVNLVATGGGISESGAIATPLLTGSAVGAVTLGGANGIAALGPFNAPGQSFTLLDAGVPSLTVNGLTANTVSLTAPVITIPGALTGTTSVVLLATGGGISETGSITTALLTGSATGTVDLAGSNTIAALGPFNAVGRSFTLRDAGAASLAVSGLTAAVISLTAPVITIPGAITGTTRVTLAATGGGISETGSIDTPQLTGSANGAVTLIGNNTIAILGPFDAAGQSFTLLDANAASLAVSGLSAAAISLTAPAITIPGSISGTMSTNLVATAGGISETGTISTARLDGSAAGTVDLTGNNAIDALGPFDATGQSFTLVDAGAPSVAINGLTAATIKLVAPAMTIPGPTTGTTSVTLTATAGGIDELGTGSIATPRLTGSAAGAVTLDGLSNQVSQLDTFTAGKFVLQNAADLTITGTLQAQLIDIDVGANTLTLANNTSIVTGGSTRPATVTAGFVFPGDPGSLPTGGAFFTTAKNFIQQGTTKVSAIDGGSSSVLRVNATGNANISFDPDGGLEGRSTTWLIIAIDTGKASGQVNVRELDVVRVGGPTGSTDLTGSIGGLSGASAAGVAGIEPGPNSNFRFNTCPIRSVNCVLLPAQGIPVANPLNDIYFGSLINPDDDDDLLLPIVSDRDY